MAQSKAEAGELLAEVRKALNLDALTPPRGSISRTFREVSKKLTFARGAVPYSIADLIGYLCAYGYEDRAATAAELLGSIDPLTWDIDYSYVRDAIHTSCFFAIQAGKGHLADRLIPFLALPGPLDPQRGRDHFQPNAYILSGGALELPFEAESTDREDPESLGQASVMDLRSLSTMWLFGGSPEWPLQRITRHVDMTIEKLHALPGWHPW